jgi:hypothetical protein
LPDQLDQQARSCVASVPSTAWTTTSAGSRAFIVPATPGSLQRLRTFLRDNLPADATARVEPALATLRSATHVRNAGQHIDAAADAAMALPSLGLTYPVTDFTYAWQTVQRT